MFFLFSVFRVPRGPTLSFKILDFTLARDVVSAQKKQMVFEEAFKSSPLIVLNNFSGEGMQMKLMASMFQNMFPTINLTTVGARKYIEQLRFTEKLTIFWEKLSNRRFAYLFIFSR